MTNKLWSSAKLLVSVTTAIAVYNNIEKGVVWVARNSGMTPTK